MDVWSIAADGGEPKRLTSFLEDEPYPAWSPDGKQLAIIATGGLYTLTLAGGEPQKIGLGGTLVQIDWR
jgi:Tol biopolymer transport system component